MAGTISNGAVFWNVGEATGKNDAGASTSLPVANGAIQTSTATPSGAPTGAPLATDSDTDALYVYVGTAWVGPYAKAT